MTMVPAPKLSKPHHFFYGGCGGGGVMSRLSEECSATAGSGYGAGYNNSNVNGVGVKMDNNTSMVGSDLGIGDPNDNNNNKKNTIVMADEEQSRTSNTSVNNNDDDDQQQAAAASCASMKGQDDSTDHHHHHQDSNNSWLQLSLGGIHMKPSSSYEQHQHLAGAGGGDGDGDGLMLELNLGGDGGRIHQTQPPLDFGKTSIFGCGRSSAAHPHPHPPPPPPLPSPPMFPLVPWHSLPHPQHPQQVLLSEDLIGWGQYGNQIITSYSAAGAGCSSSLSPSSSSSMPPPVHAQGSLFTPVGVNAPDTHFTVIHPPPRRPHSGIWFTLQASLHQSKEPFLPQLSKTFLRIKDGRMTIRLVMKYLANKLGLESEYEVEIRCRGQQLVPFLTLQHVRDNIWSPREGAVTLLPDSSTSDHLMILNYGRSCACPSSSSTYLAPHPPL